MKENFLLIVSTSQNLSSENVTAALKDYDTRQVGPGIWIAKIANMSARTFYEKVKTSFPSDALGIFEVHPDQAVLPGQFQAYLRETTRAA